MSQSGVYRSWCFTAWDQKDVDVIHGTDPVCLVVGKETCPETGKVHFQGYVRWKTGRRFSWWKGAVPTAHVEPRKGSEPEAAAYCRKDGELLHDYGAAVDVERAPDPAEHVCDLLEAGAPLWQVYKDNRKFFFHNYGKICLMQKFIAVHIKEGSVPAGQS